MSKPTWRPEPRQVTNPLTGKTMTDTQWAMCQGCGWRSVRRSDGPWCPTCLARARELGGPREAPRLLRVPPADSPRVKRRGYTPDEKAFLDSIKPVTCAVCGWGGHTSESCPSREATT